MLEWDKRVCDTLADRSTDNVLIVKMVLDFAALAALRMSKSEVYTASYVKLTKKLVDALLLSCHRQRDVRILVFGPQPISNTSDIWANSKYLAGVLDAELRQARLPNAVECISLADLKMDHLTGVHLSRKGKVEVAARVLNHL